MFVHQQWQQRGDVQKYIMADTSYSTDEDKWK
jgi:hypothetical protein